MFFQMTLYTATIFFALAVVANQAAIVKFAKHPDYQSWLRTVNDSREEQAKDVRSLEMWYNGDYGIDRHGRPFIKCKQSNSTASSRTKNIRCPLLKNKEEPACFAMYNFRTNELIQGCLNVGKDMNIRQCDASPKCTMDSFQTGDLAFCCCLRDNCNEREGVVHTTRAHLFRPDYRKEKNSQEEE